MITKSSSDAAVAASERATSSLIAHTSGASSNSGLVTGREVLYPAAVMDLLLFGIQGGGKGTQARKIVERFGYQYFEAGAELRKIVASGTDLGRKVSSFIDAGNLVPNDVMMEVVEHAVMQIPLEQHILFDGVPRFEEQKIAFDAMMVRAGRQFRGIELTVNDDLAIQRILQRGREQGRRDDQDQEKIKKRMGWTHEKTQPVIEEYRAQGIVETVDGEADVDVVFDRVLGAMEKLGFEVR